MSRRPPYLVPLLLVAVVGCGGDSAAPRSSTTPRASAAGTPVPRERSRVVAVAKTGGRPCGIAAAGNSVWISDNETATLFRVDPATGAATRAATLDKEPCEITVAFGSLWVVTQSGWLDRVDPASGRVVARVKVGAVSYEAVATPDAVWVSNRGSQDLSRVDPRTNKVTRTVPLPGINAGGITYAAGALWVGDDMSGSSRFARVDPATGAVTRVEAGDRPAYVATVDGAVWVAERDSGTASRFDAATGRRTATLPAGRSPVNLDALPGAAPEIWVPDDQGDVVTRIDAVRAAVIEVVPAPGGPAVVTAYDGHVWVTLFEKGEAWKIRPGSRE